jgi:hypothetical protein
MLVKRAQKDRSRQEVRGQNAPRQAEMLSFFLALSAITKVSPSALELTHFGEPMRAHSNLNSNVGFAYVARGRSRNYEEIHPNAGSRLVKHTLHIPSRVICGPQIRFVFHAFRKQPSIDGGSSKFTEKEI